MTPATANAVTTTYHPTENSRTFATSGGGWSGSAVYGGLGCVPGVLCPSIVNSFQASGGVDGPADGFLRTGLDGLLATLLATSDGTWESPQFTYTGAGGAEPNSVAFTLARHADVGALLAIPGNSVNYSVELVDVTNPGGSLTLIDAVDVEAVASWTAIAPIAIPPSALTVGHVYRLRITTAYETIAALIPDATADYDNVALVAQGPGAGPGPGGGTAGRGLVGKTAVLKGGKLRVKVRCRRSVDGKCKMRLVGLWKKSGPTVTKKKTVRVRAGKRKKVALKVKPRALAAVASRKKIWVAIKVKADGQKTLKVKRLKLIKRG